MKNPLFTPICNLINDRSIKLLIASMLWMVLVTNLVQAQAPVITEQCYCLNNATTATNGQYRDEITLETGIPNQTWRIVNPSGFYNPASLPPPAVPILYLNNTLIPEVSPGIYRIRGLRVSNVGYSFRVVNSITNVSYTVTNTESCRYPNIAIIGDDFVCPSAIENYSLPPGIYGSFLWSGSGGGFSVLPGSPPSVNVIWGPTAGRYSLGVTGDLSSFATQARGCRFDLQKIVEIVDPRLYTSIIGDFGNCINARETYRIVAALNQLQNVSWGVFLDPAANVPAPSISLIGNARSQTIAWPSTPGTFYLAVEGQFRINTSSDFCNFEDIRRIDIVDEEVIPLACNNGVQISMNPSCELSFSPDQFLDDQDYANSSYDIVIRDLQADTIVPNGTLGFKYINKRLEVKVIHECSGNSCWGFANIEDKSIPELICPDDVTIECTDLNDLAVTGFPTLPLGTTRTPVSGKTNEWLLEGYDKCSNVTLVYNDKVTSDLCDGPYSSIIERTWKVTDGSKNTSTCSHIISVIRADIDDVEFPNNYDDVTGPNGSLEACDPWLKITEGDFVGNPSPDFTGWPRGILCLKSAVTFTDVKLPVCGNNPNTYKLIRKWKVIDHCTAEIRTHNQFITVMDTKAPVIVCPGLNTSDIPGSPVGVAATISTSTHNCSATWKVLPPAKITDCSNTTWKVDFLLPGVNGLPPAFGDYTNKAGTTEVREVPTGSKQFEIVNLPLGTTRVRYTATDVCGNSSICFSDVRVIDNEQPIPVCDRNSIVAIGAESIAYAGVSTFDDGSHDNCAITCMKVRRMENNSTPWDQIRCDNTIRFTCDDIGPDKKVMVELYVQDAAGLSNTCMVEAKVQDNIFPTLTVPGPATANCYENLTSLSRFGVASATDNCSVIIDTTRTDQLNECGIGTITRTFTARDPGGNRTIRTQVITVGNDKKFDGNAEFPVGDITWPKTITLNASCIADVAPEKLPRANAFPIYNRDTTCAQLASRHEDIIFNFADNVCVKILRKWTVIDWCQKNPLIPGSGEWSSTQLIMLNNTRKPDILTGCRPSDLTITQVGDCKANVRVTATGSDDCTDAANLVWSYSIDENNDNTIEVNNGSGATINRDFPYGRHKITWFVKDGCKNEQTCTNIFEIKDTKKPTPYCNPEIVTVIMPVAKEVAIWASDFDLGATDNCSVGRQIKISFDSVNVNDISRTFKCSDLGGAAKKEFPLRVYAIDAAGNFDYCTVKVSIQDNGACSTNVEEEDEDIAFRGSVYNEADDMLENVKIELRSDQAEFPRTVFTGDDGTFNFSELVKNQDYNIRADKNDDLLNGVSTLDLVFIQRHILGLAELDSPYKIIAADINNSESISAADLVELRKAILGITSEFKNNRSWRFVDIAHRFNDPKKPFPFPSNTNMDNIDHDVAGLDFIGVKIGDVNGSATANSRNIGNVGSRNVITLQTDAVTAQTGDIVQVQVKANDLFNVIGMQMALNFDPTKFELVDVKSNSIGLQEENIGFSELSKGVIKLSWNDAKTVNIQAELLNLRFKALQPIQDAAIIHLDRATLSPELYIVDAQEVIWHPISLETNSKLTGSTDKFEIYQNIPNPFNATSVIGFNLPQENDVQLKIWDLSGKIVYQTNGHFNKGYNTFSVDANALNLNGVLYYQIDTETHSATRKMIIIK